ncbi:hypothetical protein Aperf_G00000041510 [Anoplocephala perfoliata]
MADNAKLAAECDNLLNEDKFREVYDKLKDRKDMDLELMWRFARAARFLALTKDESDKKVKKEWIERGCKIMEEAVEKYPKDSLSNTWYGVMLNTKSNAEGVNERIKLAYKIREYFDKGYEANPKSYFANHCLGSWCYEVSSLGKVQRAFASTFFAKPPNSTFDEALKFFLDAEKAEPVHMLNKCRIAQCYERLGKKTEAKQWATEALKLPPKDSECEEAAKECRRIVR